jgi:glucose/arabinose dehydrogenase
MYLAIGSRSNVSPGEPAMRAAVNRFDPDGRGREIFASGTRNPIGLRWYPGTDVLWAAVQERDGLGDDLVPDYFTHIQQGGFYGWPFSYIGPNEDPRNKGQRPDLVRRTIVPDVLLQGARRCARLPLLYRPAVPRRIPGWRLPRPPRLLEPIQARRLRGGFCPLSERQAERTGT